jgi:muramidase (phage lysozyme)
VADDRPFGYDTLKLRAVFVPEGNPDKISTADITAALGHDVVKIPAIFVPDGSGIPRPGYPYEYFGRYAWSEDGGVDMLESAPGGPGAGGWAAGPMQGAGDTDDAPSGRPAARPLPPTPALPQAQRYVDPVKTAVAAWRAINMLSPPSQPTISPTADGPGDTVTRPDTGPGEAAGSSDLSAPPQNDPPNRTDPLGPTGNPQGNGQASAPTPALAQPQGYVDPVTAAIATWRGLQDSGLVRLASDQRGGATGPPPNGPARPASAQSSHSIEEARVQAFLKLLREAETGSEADDESPYHRMIGGGTIASLDKFPTQPVRLNVAGKWGYFTAAGAYQITRDTWENAVVHLAKQGTPVSDFSPASQDRVAKEIIREDQALDLIRQGQIEQATPLLNRTWVSLPGGSQPAHGLTVSEARRRFETYVEEYMKP